VKITKRRLPGNCYSRRELVAHGGIVIHYFSAINVAPDLAFDVDACYDLFCDLNQPGPERGLIMPPSGAGRAYASAHYMVARDGEVIELMPPEKQAYHAGKSELAGAENLNAWTVGIELIGTGDSGFTDDQYSSLTHLCADLITKHQIPLECIVGHPLS